MVRKGVYNKWGDPAEGRDPQGVRVAIVAEKSSKQDGGKGDREMDACERLSKRE